MSTMQELVGQVVLGEHRLERLARADGALAIFEATSTVDQNTYTVVIAPEVRVETAATAIEAAIDRAGRHVVGVRGIVPLLRGGTTPIDQRPTLALVRRGPPGEALADSLGGAPRPAAEVVRLLEPLADSLAALHEQGLVHGVLGPLTVGQREGRLVLDFFGLGSAVEAASGARGYRDALPAAYRPPELRADRPSTPGPWTDIAALAILTLELLTGRRGLLADKAEPPPLATLGLSFSPQVDDLFAHALAPSPRNRPLDPRVLLRELLAGASAPAPRPSAPVATPSPSSATTAAAPPAPAPSAPVEAPAAAPSAAPAPPPPGPPPDPQTQREARQQRMLGMLIGGGLTLLLGGMAVGTIFLVHQMRTSPSVPMFGAAPSSPAPVAPPSAASTEPPAPVMPLVSRRAASAYPADQGALVPIATDGPVWGDRDALVTLVLFGDFTCPFTQRALSALPALAVRFGDDLRVVFKHYPRPAGHDAARAAEAAEAVAASEAAQAAWAHKPDSFWRMASALSAWSGPLDPAKLDQLGVQSGLPAGTVADALAKHPHRTVVDRDIELGRRLGVRGTPVTFINGRRLDGLQSPDKLAKLIAHEKRRAQESLDKGAARDQLYTLRTTANVTTAEGESKIH